MQNLLRDNPKVELHILSYVGVTSTEKRNQVVVAVFIALSRDEKVVDVAKNDHALSSKHRKPFREPCNVKASRTRSPSPYVTGERIRP